MGIRDRFDIVLGPDDVVHAKPHPEMVLKILESSGAEPHSTLFVGDTDKDMLAGRGAGVRICGVRWGYGDREEMARVHKETLAYLTSLPVEEFTRVVQVPEDGTPKLGWILWHVFEQQIHHRGELYLCLSLLGLERPETDRPG